LALVALFALAGCSKEPAPTKAVTTSVAADKRLVSDEQFDLVCTGEYTTKLSSDSKQDRGKTQIRLRVSLDLGRWCADECKETKPLAAATDGEIVFERSADREIDAYDDVRVNRETGAYTSHHRINETEQDETETCAKAPFSGFPGRKF
jgi:hypothetical protein